MQIQLCIDIYFEIPSQIPHRAEKSKDPKYDTYVFMSRIRPPFAHLAHPTQTRFYIHTYWVRPSILSYPSESENRYVGISTYASFASVEKTAPRTIFETKALYTRQLSYLKILYKYSNFVHFASGPKTETHDCRPSFAHIHLRMHTYRDPSNPKPKISKHIRISYLRILCNM